VPFTSIKMSDLLSRKSKPRSLLPSLTSSIFRFSLKYSLIYSSASLATLSSIVALLPNSAIYLTYLRYLGLLIAKALCGYGERWERVILSSLFIIGIFSILFFKYGIIFSNKSFEANTSHFLLLKRFCLSLYFSAVTFTTLGYADIYFMDLSSRIFASIEAFFGMFMIALFVLVLSRKFMR